MMFRIWARLERWGAQLLGRPWLALPLGPFWLVAVVAFLVAFNALRAVRNSMQWSPVEWRARR